MRPLFESRYLNPSQGAFDIKTSRFYKPLPKEFRRGSFDYRRIALQGNAAIYEQRWTGCAEPSVCYEVIRIKRREGFEIGARFIEPAEVYPNSNVWGVDAFTVTDKDSAFARLWELAAQNTSRPWHYLRAGTGTTKLRLSLF
jgi:hypothetical protein